MKYKDYQITPNQQALLDSDATWFTPANVQEYQGGPPDVDEHIIPQKLVATNGRDHPPLSSPESSQDTPQDESRFLTQAPPMMEDSQVNKTSVKKELKRKEIPNIETPTSDTPAQLQNSQNHQEDSQPEVEFEWPASPPRAPKLVRQMNVKVNY